MDTDMNIELERLRITAAELEPLLDLDVSESLAITASRAVFFKHFPACISLLLTEVFIVGLTVIFLIPISLVAQKKFAVLPQTPTEAIPLILLLSFIVSLVMVVWNLYLWKLATRLKPLAQVLSEVEKFNEVLDAIRLTDRLGSVQSSHQLSDGKTAVTGIIPAHREELIKALTVIRSSLIHSLKAFQEFNRTQTQIERRYEILVNLDQNLTALMTFDPNSSLSDYSQLLNEALQIGLSVHRELRNL